MGSKQREVARVLGERDVMLRISSHVPPVLIVAGRGGWGRQEGTSIQESPEGREGHNRRAACPRCLDGNLDIGRVGLCAIVMQGL